MSVIPSGVPLAIGPTGKRNLNSRMIDRFRSDSPDLPTPYLPIVDLLIRFFHATKPTPFSEISPADRNRLLDALRTRVKNYDESVRTRLNTGQLTLRTNSFSSNRSLHLKELIGELLGVGIDGANEWLRTGKAVAPAIPLPPLALDDQVRDMFRALSYAVAGPSGERAWDTFQTEPPPSPFLDPATNAGLSPLERLRYVYWGLVLRKDLPPGEEAGRGGAGAGTGAGAGAGSVPSATRAHTLPDVLGLSGELGAALRPVFEAVRAKYTAGNNIYDIAMPYVESKKGPIDVDYINPLINLYTSDASIDDVLGTIIAEGGPRLNEAISRFPGDIAIKKRIGKEAAPLLVALLLQKMLAPKVDVGTATK